MLVLQKKYVVNAADRMKCLVNAMRKTGRFSTSAQHNSSAFITVDLAPILRSSRHEVKAAEAMDPLQVYRLSGRVVASHGTCRAEVWFTQESLTLLDAVGGGGVAFA